MGETKRQISRFLAVGQHPEDRLCRLTRGTHYTCVSGSAAEHAHLQAFCEDLQKQITSSGLALSDLSPEEFSRLCGFRPDGEER